MIFNNVLGLKEVIKTHVNINHRIAVRAIILKGNDILMVHTNKGDYKFPGGGINKRETHEEGLIREVREETGYIVNNIKDNIGIMTERRLDKYNKNSIFEMISHYYLCEISDDKTHQQLDAYEIELDFSPEWVPLNKVIELNENILKDEKLDKNPWVYRETLVLNTLKKHLHDLK